MWTTPPSPRIQLQWTDVQSTLAMSVTLPSFGGYRSRLMAALSIAQVDYGATPEELQQHFLSCGTINRITILCHKPTGSPKG